MITSEIRYMKEAKTSVIKFTGKVESRTAELIAEVAEAIVADIRSSWSGSSPSAKGHAPAVVTGNLDTSIFVERTGRDVMGRFARDDKASLRFIRIDTTRGQSPTYTTRGGVQKSRGQYGMALEDPAYLNRPYLAPALDRAVAHLPMMAVRKGIFRV